MKRVLLPTLVGIFCLIALSGCSLFKSEEEDREWTVIYRISGTSTTAVDVTYKDETGTDVDIVVKNPPWEYTFTAWSGTSTYLYAKKQTAGIPNTSLLIEIFTDGERWKHVRCTTAYCSISLHGKLP